MATFSRDFELRGQIPSANKFVMFNNAEGFDGSVASEFIQFLSISKGSAAEVVSQLCFAMDQGYVNEEAIEQLSAMPTETGRKIGAVTGCLRKSGSRGTKVR